MGVDGVRNWGGSFPHHGPRRVAGGDFAAALRQAERPAPDTPAALQRPVPGAVVRPFGPDHPGVDLAAEVGTPVQAAADGVVESAGWAGAYGNLLVVRHDARQRAYYAHLSEFTAHPGQAVAAGSTIAASGNTGQAATPHLHFELRQEGQPVDPLA